MVTWLVIWLVTWPGNLTWHITPSKLFHKVINLAHSKIPPPLELCLIDNLWSMLVIETYSQCHSVNTAIVKKLSYDLMPKSLNDQSFFINGSESWKVLFLLLDLEDFIFALSIEMLEDFILVLLLDDYV